MNNNRTTVILLCAAVVIIGGIAIVGSLQSQPATPPPVVEQPQQKPKPTTAELDTMLETELPAISTALVGKYPTLVDLYIINRGALYDEGQWYGTTLTYQGKDEDSRDTLRVLMEKKDGKWIIRSTPPRPILSQPDFPDVPKSVLQTINQPAVLPGTDTSPTIN